MTRKEAWKRTKGYLYDVLGDEEADEIIKALRQEPVLDQISARIEQAQRQDFKRNRKTYDRCLQIIDKCRAESEEM